MKIMHKTLADNRWQKLSFSEQMANIGSEFGRAVNLARLQDEENKEKAIRHYNYSYIKRSFRTKT